MIFRKHKPTTAKSEPTTYYAINAIEEQKKLLNDAAKGASKRQLDLVRRVEDRQLAS